MTAPALPGWPRLLQREMAARYLSMSVPKFHEEITLGNLPASIMIGGREHWCRKALDAAVDRLVNGEAEVPDYERELNEKIAMAGGRR